MDDLFKTVNIVDSRIAHIKSSVAFGVLSGSAQNTFQAFGAISQSASTITYNVQVPSMSTVIDRNVFQKSTITLKVVCTEVPAGQFAMDYGMTDSLQAFPLNSLVTTQTATINNTSVTTNLQDILPQILRMYSKETLERYNSLTPCYPDKLFSNYVDAVGSNSNPMAGLNNCGYDVDCMPRGAFPVTLTVDHYIAGVLTDNELESTSENDTWEIFVQFTVVEPILGLSPFIHSDNNDSAGFLGINNLGASCKRVFSSSNPYITSISVNNVVGSELLLKFLSLQPEQYGKIQPRNVVNYTDLSRYIYNQNVALAATPANTEVGAGYSYNFSNIQLNQVPDLMIIACRIPMAQQNWNDPSFFLTINNVSINFNNSSGILSSANQQQLYLMSVKNGSSQSFYEFAGSAINNDNATGAGAYVATLGSLLVLNPAMDFGLPSMYTASSSGQFNFQMTINVSNQTPNSITPELVLMTVNSGLFVTENGTSQIYTGVLTRDVVLQTKQGPSHMDSSFYKRIIGGSLHNLKQISHIFGHNDVMKGAKEQGGGTCAGSMPEPPMRNMMKNFRKAHRFK